MRPYALTGGIGAGKSTVAQLFTLMGAAVYDADLAAKSMYQIPSVKEDVSRQFGSECLVNGSVDFKILATIVFNDKLKLGALNELIHPLLLEDFRKWHAGQPAGTLCLMEAAILFEGGMEGHFEGVICVTAPKSLCLQRILARGGLSEAEALARMEAQMDPQEKAARSDYILVNDEKCLLIPQVEALYQQLKKANV